MFNNNNNNNNVIKLEDECIWRTVLFCEHVPLNYIYVYHKIGGL